MKNPRLVIGNKNYSSWSLCPWLLLKMFSVPFEEIRVALYQSDTAEKLGPYSPSLKVPVLLHGEVTVWDSLAICEYISEIILGGAGWPAMVRKRASARAVCAEVHADFPALKREWPMNCKLSRRHIPSETTENEIARIDSIWSCCRRRFGENGDYLYGRFSIADCMMAPTAIVFSQYGAQLSEGAARYRDTLLANPFVQHWIDEGRREQEPLSVVWANTM